MIAKISFFNFEFCVCGGGAISNSLPQELNEENSFVVVVVALILFVCLLVWGDFVNGMRKVNIFPEVTCLFYTEVRVT